MTRFSKTVFCLVGLITIAGLAFLFFRPSPPPPQPTNHLTAATNPVPNEISKSSTTNASFHRLSGPLISLAAESLRRCSSPNEAGELLKQLNSELSALRPDDLTVAITEYFRSGQDAQTGLAFAIGPGGVLSQSPTLRTFLLDLFGKANPSAAAALSRQILSSFQSPDEWAIALRNVAWSDPTPEDRQFLAGKMEDLLLFESWSKNPSSGYLEAFDILVFLQETGFIPQLGQTMTGTNSALAHAAGLALERLVIGDTSKGLEMLLDQPDILASKTGFRADLFARADLRLQADRDLIEKYLFDPAISSGERDAFARAFPNANFRVGYNLVTKDPVMSRQDDLAKDRAALNAIDTWLAEKRFVPVHPHLLIMRQRLLEFLN